MNKPTPEFCSVCGRKIMAGACAYCMAPPVADDSAPAARRLARQSGTVVKMEIREAIRLALMTRRPELAAAIHRQLADGPDDFNLPELVDFCAGEIFPGAAADFLELLAMAPDDPARI